MQTKTDRLTTALGALVLLIGISACAGNRNNIEYEMEKMAVKQSMIPQPVAQAPVAIPMDPCGRPAVL